MSVDVNIIDGKKGLQAQIENKDGNIGQVVLTEPLFDTITGIDPLLNATYGADMNQNVTFSGTPELIFDGGSGGSEWDATAIAGTWNFADAGKVSITSANNLDEAQWDDASAGSIDMGSYTALSGKINLSVYNPLNNSILIEFALAGVPVGNSVDLNDYIDTGLIGSEQSFAIGKDDFGLVGQTIDEFTITMIRSGGARPTINFDDFQIEESGSPETYQVMADTTDIKMTHVQISMADDVTTANAQDYNALMGVPALSNGISVQVVSDAEMVFTGSFSRLIDFLQVPEATFDVGGDGTNSWITIKFDFSRFPVIMKNNDEDGIFFTINDNLSGLLFFRTFVRTNKNIT